ncbi:MAG: DUF3288 family protein [Pseudanabaena sp.]|jgi:hypothetical protein|uniref:DUF3288 family protein n=1 Tax=Pseudanabaena mucicola TaxID=71190 RepID=UPI002577A934|nr:DUF3288 family protein [Pseudanabaena mucicola]MCA6574705.1 DUF3288 family protein [Pseudanabaena sp. M53BS1SP1A06MG]MCA6580980.1 DUF3288 family protein [Pseudanabaena sp. M34BS1SP1A06MG]MCA6587109.1 DUF3288 family protein [Pseudanabaena sp. M051S1SP1A06QC]MCA6590768.1 DUF3288 family protein [Pseudanabaena sp. M38BS1SP1A06MG]MCA6596684.1 DUF3288 family protein [Pseudanabaena sp. M046S1SP1A06QC]MCA6598915.1 DUF3288 family protein [Pseudanabaena sp. M57BS1SP1A06MG]MCA6612733.1 DUF3288 famil
MVEIKDQRHPQYTKDRQVLNNLLAQNSPSNRDFADLARLTIRYKGFMGAKDIQEDLIKVLINWQITEEELFTKTRVIHAIGKVYMAQDEGQDDWA